MEQPTTEQLKNHISVLEAALGRIMSDNGIPRIEITENIYNEIHAALSVSVSFEKSVAKGSRFLVTATPKEKIDE